ncbi:MAG TPA: tetratricopeptide repeat protein [Pyrinomonadaceae bacterium]|nr:tetratricopeptide repeat protein [Pyrinomonadaceae bacterium]
MAFEKAKVIKAAEKFLSQGKITAAIKEYRQIVDHDGGDFTTLNMLGDLLVRAGEKEEASTCFLRIAEHYRDQEFRLKAIAMYRKVDKLRPRDPAIARELGDLYAAQGLIADARAQYLVVADAHTRSGDTKQTLKVLHKIADLDPQNTEVRLKLADGYVKERMQAEAARAYCEAANRLLESGRAEKALDAYSKALELRPHDRNTLRGLIAAHSALGTADEAAEILEKSVGEMPDDSELASMLAQAYVEADDPEGAERATELLMQQDGSNHRRYLEVSRLYFKQGRESDAARVLGIIIEPMLAGREESDLVELVEELLARSPDHVPTLRLLARINWWQRDMEKLRATLERLAEAAEQAELVDDERYALTQLVRLVPDEQRYANRLQTLGGVLEQPTGGADLLGSSDSVPTFESFEPGETVTEPSVQPEAGSEFEWNSVAETDESAHAGMSFADLNEDESPASADAGSDAFALVSAEPEPAQVEVNDDGRSSGQAMMLQELESVDFYITQGYTEIALDTLDILEKQFGPTPEISSRRKRLADPTAVTVDVSGADLTASLEATADTLGEIEIDHSVVSKEIAVHSGLDSGLAEIFEEFRMEAEGEGGVANEDFETHFNMATAYKEMDLMDEAVREFQIAAGLAKPGDGKSRYFKCCNMLGHCFMEKGMPQAAVLWFKKGLSAPGCNADEAKALHYELGGAYEQMDDLPSAIAAFTEVYGVDVSYRDIGDRLMALQKKEAKQKKGK